MNYFKKFPYYMDYSGQKLAERIFQVIVVTFGVVGLGLGYKEQQFSLTVYALAAGFILSCLITLPPWPFYRRHPLTWLKSKPTEEASKPQEKKKRK